MRELDELVLPALEPPPGGLARLQQSIAAEHRPVHARGWTWAAALVIPALALAVWIPRYVAGKQRVEVLSAALQQAMAGPLPGDGIRVDHGAAIELPAGQPDVRLYLVQTALAASGNGP